MERPEASFRNRGRGRRLRLDVTHVNVYMGTHNTAYNRSNVDSNFTTIVYSIATLLHIIKSTAKALLKAA